MSDIILDTSISTKDETDSLSYDEWDGLLISEWFEADPGAPVPASSREDEFKFCYQNPDAWKFVTLPKGMNRETAIQILQNEARFQVLFGDSRAGNPHHDKLGRFASKSGPSSGEPAELKSMGEINAFLRRNGIPPNQTQLTDKKEIVAAKGYASGGAGYINFDEGSSPGYQGINGYLRDPAHFKGTGAEPKIQEAIPRLDSAIARHSLKEPVKVTRIVGQDAFGIEAFPHPDTGVNLAFLSLKKGDIIQDPAYISTSMKSEVSGLVEDKFTEAFPNKVGIKMNITVPAGTNALYLEPFNPFSSHSNASAQELLLGRDSKMRIDDVIDDFAGDPDLEGSSWTLNVTVLP